MAAWGQQHERRGELQMGNPDPINAWHKPETGRAATWRTMGDMTEPAPRETVRMTVSIGGQVSPEVAAVQHLWRKRPIPPELAHDQPRMVEEWLVTGDPGNGYPPYRYTWRSDEYADPEAAARAHIGLVGEWAEGPHLSHRTVTYSSWEPVL